MHYTPLADGCRILAPAKLNLFLEILGKRPDGFHEIETVMQAIDLSDEIEFREAPPGVVEIECDMPGIPADASNLAVRAAHVVLSETGARRGVRIGLRKHVPSGAGLGGGSSDAAATLLALNRWWNLDLGHPVLHRLAASLGSDVPFFLTGGTAICRGRGEIVEPFPDAPLLHYVICMPEGVSLSTREVYDGLENVLTGEPRDARLIVTALQNRDLIQIGRELFNRLEEPAVRLAPGVKERLRYLSDAGLFAVRMSGSGAACFGICPSRGDATATVRSLASCRRGWFTAAVGVAPWTL